MSSATDGRSIIILEKRTLKYIYNKWIGSDRENINGTKKKEIKEESSITIKVDGFPNVLKRNKSTLNEWL